MTVSQKVISWLKQFDEEKIKSIGTDICQPKVNSYALVKEPVVNVRTFISGKQVLTEHYTLVAFLDSQEEIDRKENTAWGEQLEQWIKDKNNKKEFPDIAEAAVDSVEVTTPFYMGSNTNTNESMYQLSISIKYRKG